MGGRGSRSRGAYRAPKGYSTVGEIHGWPVIQDKKSGKGLPTQGPRNGGFYRKGRSGLIDQFRKYDGNGAPKTDIDKGHDHGQGDPHAHDWINGRRGPARPASDEELKKMQ